MATGSLSPAWTKNNIFRWVRRRGKGSRKLQNLSLPAQRGYLVAETAAIPSTGLPRRYAPRNDGRQGLEFRNFLKDSGAEGAHEQVAADPALVGFGLLVLGVKPGLVQQVEPGLFVE